MNLSNKLTVFKMIISVIIILILLGEGYFDSLFGIEIPKLFINESIVVDIKYIVAGVLFMIATIIDLFKKNIIKKYNSNTNFGKIVDHVSNKILIDSVLVILASQGFIYPIIPVVIIITDSVVNSVKMVAASSNKAVSSNMINIGKIQNIFIIVGIILTLFYNLPFELFNISIAKVLLFIATVLSVVSGTQYYNINKYIIKNNQE